MLSAATAAPARFHTLELRGLGRDHGHRTALEDLSLTVSAGEFIALLGLSHPSGIGLLAAFLLFRLLDILKPGPVGWADHQSGAFGIMADDVIAGLIAAGVLFAARTVWPGALG